MFWVRLKSTVEPKRSATKVNAHLSHVLLLLVKKVNHVALERVTTSCVVATKMDASFGYPTLLAVLMKNAALKLENAPSVNQESKKNATQVTPSLKAQALAKPVRRLAKSTAQAMVDARMRFFQKRKCAMEKMMIAMVR